MSIHPVEQAVKLVAVVSASPALPDPDILAGQLAPSSIRMYRRDMAAYVAWCSTEGLPTMEASSLGRWVAHLAVTTTYSPNTINRMVSAIKRLVREALAQGYMHADQAAGFAGIAGVRPRALKDRQRPHGRTRIKPSDMRKLCDAPDPETPKGRRDRALLATLASSGVRISELAGLRLADIFLRDDRYFLLVCGKTDVEAREAPLSLEAQSLIMEWVSTRPVPSEYVFTSFGGRGRKSVRALAKPLTTTSAWEVVQHYADACGLQHIKPHDFRRFVGTQLAARDIRQAQKALGHKRIDTTARYYVLDELAPGLTEGLY